MKMSLLNYNIAVFLIITVTKKISVGHSVATRQASSDPVICQDYRRLGNVTNSTSEAAVALNNSFVNALGLSPTPTKPADIHNLVPRAENRTGRGCLSESENLISEHHKHLSQYKVIIGCVLADEEEYEISSDAILKEMRESRRLLGLTLVELEDVMVENGTPPTSIRALSEANTPYFDPDSHGLNAAHTRDIYTLNEISIHLRAAVNDFECIRRNRCTADSDTVDRGD